MDTTKTVVIADFDLESEAIIAYGVLESAGITCSLMHQTLQSVMPLHTGQTRIQLCVIDRDEKLAREVLAAEFDKDDFKHSVKKTVAEANKCKCAQKK